jgi:hypothetical protein
LRLIFPVFLSLGCSASLDIIQELEWDRTDVGTVIRVSWILTEEADAWVEYGSSPNCNSMQTPVQTGVENEVLLLGLPPVTESCFVLKTASDGEEGQSEQAAFRTENVPSNVEPMEVEQVEPDAYDDGFWVGSNPSGPALVYIINRKGETVWWHMGSENAVIPQVALAPNGEGLYFNEFQRDFSIDDSSVIWMGFDGEVKARFPTPLGHHSYVWLPDGRLAYLAIDVRETEDFGAVVGDKILVTDGTDVTEIYNTWDDERLPLLENDSWDSNFYPQGFDWTHANYLSYSEARNSFTISYAHVDAVFEVDADTGEHLRSIGQLGTHTVDTGLLGRPHAAEWTEDGTLMVFTTPLKTRESRGVEIAFDDENLSTEVIWSYGEGLNYHTIIMGALRHLPNGNTLMNFGSKGILEELSPDGEVVWRAYTATGQFPGHVTFVSNLYGVSE